MSRLVLLLLLLLLAVLLVPPVRDRVSPHLQPALDPLYEWNAKNRVSTLVKLVQEQESLGRPIPNPREFAEFVETRDVQQDASMDPWGTPYYLKVQRRTYYVGSAGRDRAVGTPDDVLSATMTRRDAPRR